MQRSKRMLTMLVAMVGVSWLAGCDDPQTRITMLEEKNRELYTNLENMRAQCDSAMQERDLCKQGLLSAQQLNEQMRAQLAAIPEQADMPGDWQAVPGGAMIAIEGSVLFRPGKIKLRKASQGVLHKIASEIRTHFGDKDLYVLGHTDTDPIKKSGWKDNRELSSQRALAVVRHLQSQGISASKLVACGWGEYKPVAPNKSASGKAKNRRVEIFAVDPTIVASR